mmetsp:Transcript_873/g.3212  ORF Transcript_873/g.3212 Transcript_873/m.3212 type:complete len:268 (-) Transcript_873:1466-2269(-)
MHCLVAGRRWARALHCPLVSSLQIKRSAADAQADAAEDVRPARPPVLLPPAERERPRRLLAHCLLEGSHRRATDAGQVRAARGQGCARRLSGAAGGSLPGKEGSHPAARGPHDGGARPARLSVPRLAQRRGSQRIRRLGKGHSGSERGQEQERAAADAFLSCAAEQPVLRPVYIPDGRAESAEPPYVPAVLLHGPRRSRPGPRLAGPGWWHVLTRLQGTPPEGRCLRLAGLQGERGQAAAAGLLAHRRRAPPLSQWRRRGYVEDGRP